MKVYTYILLLFLIISINSCADGTKFKGGKTYKVTNQETKDSISLNSELDSILLDSSTLKLGPIVKDTIMYD